MRSNLRHAATAILLTSLIGACASPTPPSAGTTATATTAATASEPTTSAAPGTPSPAPSAALSRDDGWRADIDTLLEARERLHPDPWHAMARADWVAAADAVKARIPTLTNDQALVELVRLATLPGIAGREGHTGIFPFIPGSGTHEYPVLLWQFSDGLVITHARAPYEGLVDARIDAVNGHPIADVLKLVEPLAPRDNDSTLLAYGPLYMRVSELLAGLGVIPAAGPTTFTVTDRKGATRDVTIEPISAEDDIAWHGGAPLDLPAGKPDWLRDPTTPLWRAVLPDSGTLYVQYNVVSGGIDAIADEILARVQQGDVERVVVDLRHNGGGNNVTYRHLLSVLQDPAIDRPGRLVLLTGRLTFSAAANFATELAQTTGAWFAGEAMGGSPNLYGDVRETHLVNSGQSVFIATRYWQKSTPDDPRVTIEPDLPVPYSLEDWLKGRDPVLDAVLQETPPGI